MNKDNFDDLIKRSVGSIDYKVYAYCGDSLNPIIEGITSLLSQEVRITLNDSDPRQNTYSFNIDEKFRELSELVLCIQEEMHERDIRNYRIVIESTCK